MANTVSGHPISSSLMTDRDRQILIDYLHLCARNEDWHGVSDAANDLRELDARTAALRHPEQWRVTLDPHRKTTLPDTPASDFIEPYEKWRTDTPNEGDAVEVEDPGGPHFSGDIRTRRGLVNSSNRVAFYVDEPGSKMEIWYPRGTRWRHIPRGMLTP